MRSVASMSRLSMVTEPSYSTSAWVTVARWIFARIILRVIGTLLRERERDCRSAAPPPATPPARAASGLSPPPPPRATRDRAARRTRAAPAARRRCTPSPPGERPPRTAPPVQPDPPRRQALPAHNALLALPRRAGGCGSTARRRRLHAPSGHRRPRCRNRDRRPCGG